VGESRGSARMAEFQSQLLDSFRDQGHTIVTTSEADIDLLIDNATIPDGPEPLVRRIQERSQPLMLTVMKDYQLKRRPHNLVVLVGVDESLGSWSHVDVVSTARVAMGKIGSFKIVFVSGSGADEVTYCTLEGDTPRRRSRRLTGYVTGWWRAQALEKLADSSMSIVTPSRRQSGTKPRFPMK